VPERRGTIKYRCFGLELDHDRQYCSIPAYLKAFADTGSKINRCSQKWRHMEQAHFEGTYSDVTRNTEQAIFDETGA